MKRIAILIAIGAALMSSCGTQSDTKASAAKPSATPSADPAAIRGFDLTSATWLDTPRDTSVTLEGGSAGDSASGLYKLGEKPITFGDVNDDGFEDAMASLVRTQDNAYSEVWYVWLWQPADQSARQLPDPIAETQRCGTVVTGIKPVSGAFELREQYRDPYDVTAACSSEPPRKVTRTIAVVADSPVQKEGFGGYGGMCPQPPPGDADSALIRDTKLFAGSSETSARVEGKDIDAIHGLSLQGIPWLERDAWTLVAFTAAEGSRTFAEYGTYLPCAWSPKA